MISTGEFRKGKIFSDKKAGLLSVLIAGSLWGTIGVFVQELKNHGATVETISVIRVAFAAIIMFAICSIKCGVKTFLVDRKTLFVCLLLGIICHGIYNIFYSIAVIKSGVAVSAILLDVAPIFTFIFSVLLFREKVRMRKVIGIMINVMGCILAVIAPGAGVTGFGWIGILCGIGAGVTYSLTAIIGRLAGERTNAYVMSFYSYLSAAVFLTGYMLIRGQKVVLNPQVVTIGFFYALIPTAVAYVIYYKGVQRITDSSKVPVYASAEVVVACILGVILYKEKLSGINLVGILLVFLSIMIINGYRGSEYR